MRGPNSTEDLGRPRSGEDLIRPRFGEDLIRFGEDLGRIRLP